MFEFLKKKVAAFTDKVKDRIEKKGGVEKPAVEEIEKLPAEPVGEKQEAQPEPQAEEIIETIPEPEKTIEAELEAEPEIEDEPIPEPVEEPAVEHGPVIEPTTDPEPAEEIPVDDEPLPEPDDTPLPEPKARELKAKVSVKGKLRGFLKGSVKVEERDISEFLEEFEFALLEGDVEQETAEHIVSEIRKELVGKEVPRGKDVSEFLKQELKNVLSASMETEGRDLLGEMREKKPYVILFLGPNGAGKTTSIAKLTHMLQGKGKSVIWAAGDTFRAASIEQLEKHAEKLGVRVVKHQYGSDPAAVAFDAIKAAEAKKADVVMIDSAGRQETNKNLMGELEKIVRVAKPDLKVYVGESYTGQALLQQAMEFNEKLGIDGFILTKIDCDAKGGTAISLLYRVKKPILFIGTGQEYKDLREFKTDFIIDRVIG
ncbi:signal recognition particle-docking protein FtsY [Candidatus Micrarchaeota archaeon]|nr:signal recognition particle-docking protein FtsY [Candidatus Micrarchaeota archaeon]